MFGAGPTSEDRGVVAVFGKGATAPVNVFDLDSQGLNFDGAFESTDPLARSFGGAGDVTGDGAADVVIGVLTPDPGAAYVVSARPTAQRRLAELRFHIASFGLPAALQERLFNRLGGIESAYLGAHHPATCRRLDRLTALTHRLYGRGRLTAAQAFTIVAATDRVRTAAGCR